MISADLAIIKNIIKAVQSTGLTVVSTICDQVSTKVVAINRLLMETLQKYILEEK